MQQKNSEIAKRLFQSSFSPDIFRARREKVIAAMEPGSVAIIPGAEKNSTHDIFRQSNDFYYLCGIETPHAYLLLDANTKKTSIFLPHRSFSIREKEGELLCAELANECKRLTGIDEALGIEELANRLESFVCIYTPFRQLEGSQQSWDTLQRSKQEIYSDPWDGRLDRIDNFIKHLRERCAKAQLRDLRPILDRLRLIKDPAEIEILRRAGSISAMALVEAMRSTKPGIKEYQLDAAIQYIYRINGAKGSAYRSIIASGDNAWYGHYEANADTLCNGDLVLVDAGAEYEYYTSDVTRMWPVGGAYSPIQRQLYGFIVQYHKTLIGLIRPGIDEVQIRAEAKAIMSEVVEKTKFSKGIYEAAARRSLDFPHLTHSVGLSVHDVGTYKGNIIQAGTVFALDPQLIIPEERLYIRVEDTILVTENGCENLTAGVPLDIEDVEVEMKKDGIISRYPPMLN
jgi:Xaa-Pro aminopeptidase